MQSSIISEEAYCTPWDLKIQEEKFKLFNEQQITSSYIRKPFHRAYSVRASSRKKSFVPRERSPPVPPPLPPGGFTPSCLCLTNNNIDPKTSRGFSIQRLQPVNHQSRLIQTSLIDNLHGRSLQQIPNSSCQYSDDVTTFPIDRYFWFHYAMSRRQAERILESRSLGSFLVRQSESGNQNDYSLSIRTANGCMHMRISYSNGFYILGECSRPFSSISCMIKYFTHTSVPIRGATHIKLGTPISRWEILSSSLSNEKLL